MTTPATPEQADPDRPDADRPGRPAVPDAAALRELADALTPARLFLGSAGLSHRTTDALALRADHAAARDAVAASLDLGLPAMAALGLFEIGTEAGDPATHLVRPDLGRRLTPAAIDRLRRDGTAGADLQVVVGDGLSAAAVHRQIPALLPRLESLAAGRGWSWGRPFAVRHCRVGVLNDIGATLDPRIVVLLIGERPGLATAESISAYLAWRPRPGCTDADRNVVSNIHERGTPPGPAAARIVALAGALVAAGRSGALVKEPELPEVGQRSGGQASARMGA